MIEISQKGDFSKAKRMLEKMRVMSDLRILDRYGKLGVSALSGATPVDTGKTASSWSYKIVKKKNGFELAFHNSNVVDQVPIAIVIQYGHGTRNGGYVKGVDYINPALKPIFDKLSNDLWKEVTIA